MSASLSSFIKDKVTQCLRDQASGNAFQDTKPNILKARSHHKDNCRLNLLCTKLLCSIHQSSKAALLMETLYLGMRRLATPNIRWQPTTDLVVAIDDQEDHCLKFQVTHDGKDAFYFLGIKVISLFLVHEILISIIFKPKITVWKYQSFRNTLIQTKQSYLIRNSEANGIF